MLHLLKVLHEGRNIAWNVIIPAITYVGYMMFWTLLSQARRLILSCDLSQSLFIQSKIFTCSSVFSSEYFPQLFLYLMKMQIDYKAAQSSNNAIRAHCVPFGQAHDGWVLLPPSNRPTNSISHLIAIVGCYLRDNFA